MPQMARGHLAPGGGVVYAQPAAAGAGAIAPQLDRGKAILALGLVLVGVNYITSHAVLAQIVFGLPQSENPGYSESPVDVALQLGGVGILYLVSRLSDLAGTAAVVFLVGVWVVFIWRHAAGLDKFINSGGTGAVDKTKPKTGGGK